jgi:2'-5' RNA ligase
VIRLFVALEIPEQVRAMLVRVQSGVPGARWAAPEHMHLTLRFIGEVDEPVGHDIDDALSGIRAPTFEMELAGVGEFGGKNPRALWAGVRGPGALLHLQMKIETALQRFGLEPERRKFTPHVTLARLKAAPQGRVMDFLTDHALFSSGLFRADHFVLFSSLLGSNGPIYRAERVYALAN